ncbi:MAG: PP2C family protein-serine/threonine phosphatase [Deltaproteobacteria bacterium]|nr:PP2C family protein-serine/threonine phosphatase [Deltaproteobacteria bacterium]
MRRIDLRSPGVRGLLLVAGCLALILGARFWDEASRWSVEIDRGEAIEEARSRVGWKPGMTASTRIGVRENQDLTRLLMNSSQPETRLSPVIYVVSFRGDEDEGRTEVELSGDGDLLVVRHRGGEGSQQPLQAAAADQLAREALASVVGDRLELYEETYREELAEEVWKYRWQDTSPPWDGLDRAVDVTVSEGRVQDLELETVVQERPADWSQSKSGLGNLLTLCFLGAVLILVGQSLRYFLTYGSAMRVGMVVFGLAFLRVFFTFPERLHEQGGWVGTVFGSLFDPMLFSAVAAAVFYGAGMASVGRALPATVQPLESLLAGQSGGSVVTDSVRRGVATGFCLALVPVVLAALGIFDSFQLRGAEISTLAAPFPGVVCLLPRLSLAPLALFGFLVPWLYGVLRRPGLARTVGVLVGAVLMAPTVPAMGPPSTLVFTGLLLMVILDRLFHRQDLIAVLVAVWASGVASEAAALIIQPGPLRLSGLFAFAVLLATPWLARWVLVGAFGATEDLIPAEKLRPLRRVRAERERIKAQLTVAQEAQRRMLPETPPEIPGWSLAAICRPAQEVGGDLYDFVPAEDGKWAVLVGDVSGKGMVASLYMTLTKGSLLAAGECLTDPGAVLREVNGDLHQITERSTFVTLWYGLLDPETGQLDCVRAGHNPPLWRRFESQSTVSLRPKGLPLGAVASGLFGSSLGQESVRLEPGDALFVYSDGLTEAMNSQQQEYGEDRLTAIVASTDGLSASEARDKVLADVDTFIGGAPQHDDMTLVVLRFEG